MTRYQLCIIIIVIIIIIIVLDRHGHPSTYLLIGLDVA